MTNTKMQGRSRSWKGWLRWYGWSYFLISKMCTIGYVPDYSWYNSVESLTLSSDKIPKMHYSFAALGATVFSDACHLVLLLTAQYLHNTGKYSILMPKLFAAVVICRFHWLYAWPAWLPRLVAELVLIYFLLLHSFICVC